MITLDQVLVLQEKVKAAVEKINRLEKENAELRAKLAASTSNNQSLTQKVSNFEAEQDKIEAQILQVLNSLNTVEDTIRTEMGTSEPEESVTSEPVTENEPVSEPELPYQDVTSESPINENPETAEVQTFEDVAFTEAAPEEAALFAPEQPEFDSVPSPESNGQLDIF